MTPNWIRTARQEDLSRREVQPDADILLIENDHDIADMYAFGLKAHGFAVSVAASRDSARERLNVAERNPGVIVLDAAFRHRIGLRILDELRESPTTADVPVIVLVDDTQDSMEAYRHGATDCHARFRTTPKELVSYVTAALKGGAARAKTL